MQKETIKIINYIDIFKYIAEKNNEYNILIDFHSQKKWIKSKNITITLIPCDEDSVFFDYRKHLDTGYYIRDKNDNSIKYICNIHGRYEYFLKNFRKKYISSYLDSRSFCRNDLIGLMNTNSDTFIDNGKNKIYYDCPEVYPIFPTDSTFIVEKRKAGGTELYDKDTKQLKYICNIGRRYEYLFEGEYPVKLSTSLNDNDIIIQLVQESEKSWIQVVTVIEPFNNPYIVHERNDGGVDLLLKKDNTLKYICNIGKNFYYLPAGHKLWTI
jgi:hypothetical protein